MRINSLSTTCGKDTHLALSDCVTVPLSASEKTHFFISDDTAS